jgi:hypothetical protein
MYFALKGESMMSGWRKRDQTMPVLGGTGGDYVMIWIDSLELILPKMGMKRCVSKSQAFAS